MPLQTSLTLTQQIRRLKRASRSNSLSMENRAKTALSLSRTEGHFKGRPGRKGESGGAASADVVTAFLPSTYKVRQWEGRQAGYKAFLRVHTVSTEKM